LAIALALLAQSKEDQRLADSTKVLTELLQGDKGLPKSVLDQAMCVLIFPSVKKLPLGSVAVTGAAYWSVVRVKR
jgi:lipid-binding SYLF domain-containing protein